MLQRERTNVTQVVRSPVVLVCPLMDIVRKNIYSNIFELLCFFRTNIQMAALNSTDKREKIKSNEISSSG